MKTAYIRVALVVLTCVTSGISGCSGGGGDESTEVDYSQLPVEQQAIDYAAQGDVKALQPLMDEYPDLIGIYDENGRTLLHFAAANGHSKMVQYLLDQGADPNALDTNSETPADAARQMAHANIASILEEAQATNQ